MNKQNASALEQVDALYKVIKDLEVALELARKSGEDTIEDSLKVALGQVKNALEVAESL